MRKLDKWLTKKKLQYLKVISSIMKAEKCQIVIHHAVLLGKRLIDSSFIFKHNSDSKHTLAILASPELEWEEKFANIESFECPS